MDAETFVWTLVLFGGTVVVVAWLLYWAWRKDREKTRAEGGAERPADTGC